MIQNLKIGDKVIGTTSGNKLPNISGVIVDLKMASELWPPWGMPIGGDYQLLQLENSSGWWATDLFNKVK